jgi:hypothetical protein
MKNAMFVFVFFKLRKLFSFHFVTSFFRGVSIHYCRLVMGVDVSSLTNLYSFGC